MSVSNPSDAQPNPDDQVTRGLSDGEMSIHPPVTGAPSGDLSICPPNDQIAQLVSGSLAEAEALGLFKHIDRCSSCQHKADQLVQRQDPMLVAARVPKEKSGVLETDPMLSKLIRKAQRMPRQQETRVNQASSAQTVSADDFLNGLRRCGLMGEGEVDQLLHDLSWDGSAGDSDGSSLAKLLIDNRKLTKFQAKLLLRGRWQGLVLGNYAILEKLGQGGMGAVFKARHTRMSRDVCLKVVNAAGRQSPAVIERFRNEARALAALSHPNIVVAHDANESKGIPYLVMEYVEGDDLAKRIRKDGPLSVAETLSVVIQTARALQYAHAEGITHRDIKPHNLVARTDPTTNEMSVKVLDLGLARFDTLMTNNPDASLLAAMTNTGVVIGTVDYMSPEQALDSRNADARSDIYSLGCTIFFLLTGRPPFQGDTVMQRLVAHREQLPPSLCDFLTDGVTPQFNAVVQKMLAKNPDARYQSMDGLLADLRAIVAGEMPSVSTTPEADPIDMPPAAIPAASPLDIEVDASTAAVVSRLLTRRRDNRRNAWYRRSALVSSAAAVALIMSSAIYLMMPRVGAAQAIRNGGDGRALVIVSSDKFNEDEFKALTNTLKKDNVNFVTASPRFGTDQKDYGTEIKSGLDNVNLTNVKANEFDAIFVLGGHCVSMTHKDPTVHKVVKQIVGTALQNDVVLTGSAEGYHVLMDTGLPKREEYKKKQVHKTHGSNELSSKASLVFAELRKPEK